MNSHTYSAHTKISQETLAKLRTELERLGKSDRTEVRSYVERMRQRYAQLSEEKR